MGGECDAALGLFAGTKKLPKGTRIQIRGSWVDAALRKPEEKPTTYRYAVNYNGIGGTLIYESTYPKSLCDSVNSPMGLKNASANTEITELVADSANPCADEVGAFSYFLMTTREINPVQTHAVSRLTLFFA